MPCIEDGGLNTSVLHTLSGYLFDVLCQLLWRLGLSQPVAESQTFESPDLVLPVKLLLIIDVLS